MLYDYGIIPAVQKKKKKAGSLQELFDIILNIIQNQGKYTALGCPRSTDRELSIILITSQKPKTKNKHIHTQPENYEFVCSHSTVLFPRSTGNVIGGVILR